MLADSANHRLIDGSGMVRQPSPSVVVSGVGDAFVMNMRHERFGYYQMRSEIVEYEAGRRLVWEPVRVAGTESFDCTRSTGICGRPSQKARNGATR